MSVHQLAGAVLLGALFVAAMVGASRMDVHGSGHAESGDAGHVERVDRTLSNPLAVKGSFGLVALLAVVVLAVALGPLEGLVGGVAVVAVFLLIAVLAFAGTYGAAKRWGQGTAHALAAGLFVAGLVLVLLVAADLTRAVNVVR